MDRSTVAFTIKTAKDGALDRLAAAKPGRPGKTARDTELEDAHAEIERLKATVCEQAVELHLYRGYASDVVRDVERATTRAPGCAAKLSTVSGLELAE